MNEHASKTSTKTLEELHGYRGYLKAIAVVKLGCRLQAKVDASDVVQQTMLDAYRDLPQFRGQDEAQFKAWLREILANNLKGEFRYWKAQIRDPAREVSLARQIEQSSVGMERFLAAEQTSPSQQALRNEKYDRLADALTRLRQEQRVAVILKHFEGWSLAEIAQEMNKSTMAVAGLLKRGLNHLHQLMSESECA
jgi:RNA polymerase sigma-70 factor (ECF subfamily)